MTVHACSPQGSGQTPCCGMPPLELDGRDRITTNPDEVHLLTADATPEPAEVEPEPEIEYGFYDSEHPETIYWSTFGGLVGFTTADMARHTADKSVWGRAVIVRRPRGATEHEVVPDDE